MSVYVNMMKTRSRACLKQVVTTVARCSTNVGCNVATAQSHFKLKATDLPCVSTWKTVYRMIFKGYFHRLHELQVYEKRLYGPMYRKCAGSVSSVALSSADLVEELLRQDDKFPSRGDMELWTEYRDARGFGYGPFTEQGNKWYKLRRALNKRMLHPKDCMQYEHVINKVITDFMRRIEHVRKISPTGDLVTDISKELYNFALEGISSILFETRIGCLETQIPMETQDFVNSIAKMFSNSMPVVLTPKWSRSVLPFWGRYTAGWEGIFTFASKLIDMKMAGIQKHVDRGQEVEGADYLTFLLSNTDVTIKEVYGTVAELLLAGVDTISNTLMWTLYQLSREPKIQDTLYQEVNHSLESGKIPVAQDVTNMQYLKAVIKEALRMYPVVPINARLISEGSVTVGGHHFPKKTMFTLCHYAISQDEKVFPEPSRFKPERWLRDGRSRPNPFGSIPFGFGVRGCVGRRIAELEMHLLLARIIKLYEIKPDQSVGNLKVFNRTVLVADRQLNLHFIERR